MSLLEFARGPGLTWATLIMVGGVLMRVVALLSRRRVKDRSPAREGASSAWAGALHTIVQRTWPARPFREVATLPTAIAYTFHLGILVILILGTPHILFFSNIVGFVWPGLPKGIIDVVSAVTLGALFVALIRRITHPVRRLLSDSDDYVSWLLTTLPVITGLLATTPLGGRYDQLLAVHILSVEVLMIWFPFGKLMHAIFWLPSRGFTGARFAHRGART